MHVSETPLGMCTKLIDAWLHMFCCHRLPPELFTHGFTGRSNKPLGRRHLWMEHAFHEYLLEDYLNALMCCNCGGSNKPLGRRYYWMEHAFLLKDYLYALMCCNCLARRNMTPYCIIKPTLNDVSILSGQAVAL